MSTYKPDIKIYYGPIKNENRLIPAPDMDISVEFNYSNETIIGYTYIINLKGVITGLDLRNHTDNAVVESETYGIGAVIDHIHTLRKILSQNGSVLHVIKNDTNSTHILRARGGILRSFSIEPSSNNWIHYAEYSASIEFNHIDFGDTPSSDNCSVFLDNSSYSFLLDKYKLKIFSDSWSFTFDENEAFNKLRKNDENIDMNINNSAFNIQYTISATGKHHWDYNETEDSTTNHDAKLLPAYEQAKNFVQERLFTQVKGLIQNVLKDNSISACSGLQTLSNNIVPSGSGLMGGLAEYKVFNEKISCDISESEGSFSATYTAIVKTTNTHGAWSSPETKHTINKSIKNTMESNKKNISISLNGTIEGLIEGGIINNPTPIELPNKGNLFIHREANSNKYNNAKNLLDKLIQVYGNNTGECDKRDLKKQYKDNLGITADKLGTTPQIQDCIPDPPHPSTFNLTHDYNAGTINYSIEYTNSKYCSSKFQDISIQITNPTKVTAVFNIPNSNSCAIIQELGTYTSKKVTITIQGIDKSPKGKPSKIDMDYILDNFDVNCYDAGYLPITLPPPGTYTITQKQYTSNPLNGSFTINLSYTCNPACTLYEDKNNG